MMLLRRFVESSNCVGLLLCIIFKSINGNGQCPSIHWLSVSSTTCLAISTDLSKELMAWGQAVEACPEIHPMARLASFPTHVHFDLLASNLRPTVSYWVGLRTQKPVGDKVTWLDGTVDNTSHFYIARNQLQNELCCYVTVNQFSPYLDVTWTLDDCGIQLPFICQFENENGDKTTEKLKQILTTEEVSTTPTFENLTTDIPQDFQFREKIVTKMRCNTSSVEDCLATVINMTSDSRKRNQNVMTSFYELLDDLSEMIGKGAVTQLVDDIQLYARILDVNLGFCQPYESSCTEKRKSDLLEKAELFTDNVVLSEDSDPDFKEFSFTLDQLDMFMVKSVYGAIRGRTLQMKSGVITIEDIAPSQQVNNSARIFVSAMIMHLPRSNVQFIQQSQDDLFDAALVSPVLTLKAYMEKSKVNVIHNFSLLAKSYENDSNVPVCAFQRANESNNSDGDVWDTKGCMVVEDQGPPAGFAALGPLIDRSGGPHGHRHNLSALRQERVIGCHCNHTTNFAILMQTVEFQMKDADALALSIITYIGCSVTLITQIMAITVFTCIRSLNSERVCVHRNLCITIMMAQVTFIAGVTAVDDKVVCAVVAVSLHYLYTATFVWMLVEGLHLYSQVVRVFGTEKSRILYYIFFGWGVPLVLVAISAAVDWDGYGNNRSCWLSIQRATIWAFVGPAIAIILVNLVILILVLRIVITSSKVDKQDSMKNVRAGIKASLFLAPLLGLTWIFGLASVSEQLVAFQYIFAILNSLQGFFIFLFHCALNTEVRQALARLRERRSLQKGDFGSSTSSSRPSSSDSRSSSGGGITVSERWTSMTKSRNRIEPSISNKETLPDILSQDETFKSQGLNWKTNLL